MKVLGVDFGGTQIRAGLICDTKIENIISEKTPSSASESEVLDKLFEVLDQFKKSDIIAIGIGVPSVVDVKKGIVYDVQNIPSWKEVHLKSLLEERYNLPVLINNDANCFVLGEKYFGKGKIVDSMVGLTLGTGLGGGVIIHNQLYSGINCGAAEFGMIEYLEHNYEYYASGQLFENIFNIDGAKAYKRALAQDEDALTMFRQFGMHLGHAIKTVLYSYDPKLIILGGSISKAFPMFEKSMREIVNTFAYPNSLKELEIKISELDHIGILGAAALWYDHKLDR